MERQDWLAREFEQERLPPVVAAFRVVSGRIVGIDLIVDPARLHRIERDGGAPLPGGGAANDRHRIGCLAGADATPGSVGLLTPRRRRWGCAEPSFKRKIETDV